MITNENLSKTPHAFRSLCGYSVAEFDALCRVWTAADQKARSTSGVTREETKPRQHAVGGGRKYALDKHPHKLPNVSSLFTCHR